MQLSEGKRKLVLGVLLCATLAATIWVNQNDDAMPEVVTLARLEMSTNSNDSSPTSGPIPELNLKTLQSRKEVKEAESDIEINGSLFAVKSWIPPSPAPAQLQPTQAVITPPVPTAPALPFTYMGKMEDNGQMTVYLVSGEQAYSVSVGDTIDESYKIENIEAGQVVFTYLPMSIKQTLKIGS